ncbi:hypothetical protein MD484_g7986, partial [Candolleomyces efflorescens]
MTPSASQANNSATRVNGQLNIPIPAVDLAGLDPCDGFTLYLQDQLRKDKALLESWEKARIGIEQELESKYNKLPPEEKSVYENMVVMPPGWA